MGWCKKTEDQFLLDCHRIHGDRYLYDDVVYIGDKSKVKIICKIHGVFEQVPHIHLKGCNCPKCGNVSISNKMKQNIKSGIIKGWSHINTDVSRRSYPEKFFVKVFSDNDFFSKFKIVEKFSYGKYFIDFLFIELKLIVEIDGSQHYQTKEAIEHDTIRDKYFLNEGFKVYRINWKDVYKNPSIEISLLIDFISNIDNESIRKYELKDISYNKKSLKNKNCKLCNDPIWHTSQMCIKCSNKSRING